jgi:hypothetical protein
MSSRIVFGVSDRIRRTGISWTAEQPFPTTTTSFPFKSTLGSQAPLCTTLPSNLVVSKGGELGVERIPAAEMRMLQVRVRISPESRFLTTTVQSPVLRENSALSTAVRYTTWLISYLI